MRHGGVTALGKSVSYSRRAVPCRVWEALRAKNKVKWGTNIDRRAYAELYGPTVGDRVQLGDSALFIQVEADRTHYGDEVTFGGGKVIRDGGRYPP